MQLIKREQLRKKIRAMEDYLGPILNYQDEGAKKIPLAYQPQAVWIYEYYHELKLKYYNMLKKAKRKKSSSP